MLICEYFLFIDDSNHDGTDDEELTVHFDDGLDDDWEYWKSIFYLKFYQSLNKYYFKNQYVSLFVIHTNLKSEKMRKAE